MRTQVWVQQLLLFLLRGDAIVDEFAAPVLLLLQVTGAAADMGDNRSCRYWE